MAGGTEPGTTALVGCPQTDNATQTNSNEVAAGKRKCIPVLGAISVLSTAREARNRPAAHFTVGTWLVCRLYLANHDARAGLTRAGLLELRAHAQIGPDKPT